MGAINSSAARLTTSGVAGPTKAPPGLPSPRTVIKRAGAATSALSQGDRLAAAGDLKGASKAYQRAGSQAASAIREIDALVKLHPQLKPAYAKLRAKMEGLRLEAFARRAELGIPLPTKPGRPSLPKPGTTQPAPDRPRSGPF